MKAFSLGKSIRQFGIMILAIILCLTSFSCVKNLNTPKLDDDSQFKIKFNKGDKYKSTLELSQSSTAVSCGHEINFSLSSKYTQNIEVLDVAEDGSGLLKITFLNLIMTLESPEEKRSFTFNARNPVWPDDRKHDDLFDLYPEMVDEHLLMKVSYKGKVLKVQGLEERNQRVLEKAKKKNKAFKSEWIVNQKALFSEEVEAIALENLWRFLPGDPTGKSGRWTKERIQSIGDDVYMYKDEIMLLEKTRESCTYKVISDFDSKTAKVESNTKSDSDEGFRTHDISTYQVNSKTN